MIESARADKRGHWPAGKRRNAYLLQRQLAALLRRVRKAVDETSSCRELAGELGVSDRAVRRWLGGEDNPSADSLIGLQQWLDARQR